jgi:uncharacterized protein (UPF0335 family)
MSDNGSLNNSRAADELKSFRDRLANIIRAKRALAEDEAALKTEISSRGLNAKVIATLAKQYLETSSEKEKRRDYEAQFELYAATLGMSDEPLSDRARARMLPPEPPHADDDVPLAPPQTPLGPTAEDIEAAGAEGREAFAAGIKVTANPYPAGDPRRTAWDNGWCLAAGSDGMDIPAHLRRPEKPKKPKPEDEPPENSDDAETPAGGDDDPSDEPSDDPGDE